MHAIPIAGDAAPAPAEIDVLEVYNARLLFEAYNDEALRFARKYGLLRGRRLGRARAAGRRHRRAADAPLRRPGGVPALAPHRRGAAPAEVARATSSRSKWVAQVKESVGSG